MNLDNAKIWFDQNFKVSRVSGKEFDSIKDALNSISVVTKHSQSSQETIPVDTKYLIVERHGYKIVDGSKIVGKINPDGEYKCYPVKIFLSK